MSGSNGRAFNDWLRSQLKAKKMSQRQLAQQSGVDHSTISRLIRGDRMPSLGTATKLARGLREIRDEDDGPQYLRLVGGQAHSPTARVEYALRADDVLGEAHVRQVMEYYLAVRRRRLERAARPAMPAFGNGHAPDLNGRNGNGHAPEDGVMGGGLPAPTAPGPAVTVADRFQLPVARFERPVAVATRVAETRRR
jgi:transcriptional regulator with XRE-family HTH domain